MATKGTEGDLSWEVEQAGEYSFEITVRGPGTRIARTTYETDDPTRWGIGVEDQARINELLDAMIEDAKQGR